MPRLSSPSNNPTVTAENAERSVELQTATQAHGSNKSRRFLTAVISLMTGGMIGQIIPLAMSPFLTRIYSPDDFGEYALFSATTSILAIFATMRFELAIVLSTEDREAANILKLCAVLSLLWSTALLLIALAFGDILARAAGHQQLSSWLLLVPAALLFRATFQGLHCWANRRGNFHEMAASTVLQSGGAVAFALAFGIIRLDGLILGATIAPLLATIYLWYRLFRARSRDREIVRTLDLGQLKDTAISYRQFPMFNFPTSLLNVVSQRFFIYALVVFNDLRAAGLFGFSRTIVLLPISLLAQSLGRVFFREAVLSKGTPRLEELTLTLMSHIASTITPLAVFAMYWAPQMFRVIFGDDWLEAGRFASVFAPVALIAFFTSWPERIYEVYKRQDLVLKLQITSDVCTIALVYATLRAGFVPLVAVVVYSVAQTAYHITYLVLLFRVAHFPLVRLISVFSRLARCALATTLLVCLLSGVLKEDFVSFIVGALLVGIYVVIATRRLRNDAALMVVT